jgi:hypothetical protein
MFDINAGEAAVLLGLPAMVLAAYVGWKSAGRAKTSDINNAPGVNQTGMALLIDGRVLDRLTIACDRIAEAIDKAVEESERKEERERIGEQSKMLSEILAELKRKPL